VHLSRYTLGDRSLEREVLELFANQSALYVERLRAAASDKEWQDAAHSLKGSAKAVGAWRVAACAERAEALSGEDLVQRRDLELSEIEAALREVESYIAALLANR
jgi:HPt (histidine-containing phosphotransfer) domain-containing protein